MKKAFDEGKLNTEKRGLRFWRRYSIDINKLTKKLNTEDGYLIDVFIESADGYDIHLGEIRNGRIYPESDNASYQKFMSERKQITRQ